MNSSLVSCFLKEGTIVTTKLGSNSIWYQSIIYKNSGDIVYVPLTYTYLENFIMIGMDFSLKYSNELFEYIFEGIVTDIKPEYPGHVAVQISKTEELVNTRLFPRYDTYLASNIRPLWNEVPNFCIVTNISLGGIAFVSKYHFDYGEETEVTIYFPNSKIIYGKGKIIRKITRNSYHDYSMQFVEMDEDNNNLLSEYLELHSQELMKLMNDFHENIKNLL